MQTFIELLGKFLVALFLALQFAALLCVFISAVPSTLTTIPILLLFSRAYNEAFLSFKDVFPNLI